VAPSVAAIRDALARVMPEPRLLEVAATTGEGIGAWLAWLDVQRARSLAAPRPATALRRRPAQGLLRQP
jgi:hypothetical protein